MNKWMIVAIIEMILIAIMLVSYGMQPNCQSLKDWYYSQANTTNATDLKWQFDKCKEGWREALDGWQECLDEWNKCDWRCR